MVLADGLKRCRFCGAALSDEFWASEPAARPAPEVGSGMFAVGSKPDGGQSTPNSTVTPLPWSTSGSKASPLPGVPEVVSHEPASGRLAPLSFEKANELAFKGESSPAIPAPPKVAPPAAPIQANLRIVGLVALAVILLTVGWILRSAGDHKAEAGSPVAVCAEKCEKEARTSPDAQSSPQNFISSCMSQCLRPAPETRKKN